MYPTLAGALDRARRWAADTKAAHVVTAEVSDGALWFTPMLSTTYAELRERGRAATIAPVASVLPNGTVEVYRTLSLTPALTSDPEVCHVSDHDSSR